MTKEKPVPIIEQVGAREILDSRGNPTVEVEVALLTTARSPAPRCRRARRPASTRRWNCATAVAATAARVSTEGGEGRARRDRARRHRPRRRRPAAGRPGAARPRRHAGQVAAGGQRDPRGVARGGQGRGGLDGAAAVPLPRRAERAHPAGADDEHPQRRRARRHRRRRPGVHGRADRRAHASRRHCAGAPRCTTR